MTGNMSYLTDFEEINGGYVAFGGNPKGGKIIGRDDDEDVGTEADINNLDAFMLVSPIQTTRIHKDHLVEQIIRDLNLAPQTRRMTKNLEEHEEPKRVIHALKDLIWIEAMQDELL
ncbi:hypothetical protein Tco_0172123 [Tanacetum coccineum]